MVRSPVALNIERTLHSFWHWGALDMKEFSQNTANLRPRSSLVAVLTWVLMIKTHLESLDFIMSPLSGYSIGSIRIPATSRRQEEDRFVPIPTPNPSTSPNSNEGKVWESDLEYNNRWKGFMVLRSGSVFTFNVRVGLYLYFLTTQSFKFTVVRLLLVFRIVNCEEKKDTCNESRIMG